MRKSWGIVEREGTDAAGPSPFRSDSFSSLAADWPLAYAEQMATTNVSEVPHSSCL